MAQDHCELPHLGRQATFPKRLDQHLQGVLIHGRRFFLHRTYHNTALGANHAIHALLLSIESVLEEIEVKGETVPNKLYLQVVTSIMMHYYYFN